MRISLAETLLSLTFLLSLSFTPATTFAENNPHHHAKQQFIVGFAQDTLANDWRLAQVNQLKAALASHPEIKLVVTDAGGNSARQIQDMENFAHEKVDLLITSPRDGVASTPAISRIYQQGIPVVLITRSIANNDYTSLVTPDDHAIAAQAAKLLARKLSGKGNILVLQGVPSATTAQARTSGFMDAIARFPGIKISAMKAANYLRSDAILATEQVINDGILFDAIYAQSDSMASGARLALLKNGISPDKILIVGIDYINEARDAIRSGQQLASFVYPTCAEETAATVIKILHGKAVDKKIKVPSQMVTRDNVNSIKPIF